LRAVSPLTFHGHDGPTLVTSERLSQQRQSALRSVIGFERRSCVAAFLAAIILGSGILNLISVVGGVSQPTADHLEPLECVHLGLQELEPILLFKATAKLGEFLEARFSQSF